jgi:hypothetical protein
MERHVVNFHFLLGETWFLFLKHARLRHTLRLQSSLEHFLLIVLIYASSTFPAVIEIYWEFLKYLWKQKKNRVFLIWKKKTALEPILPFHTLFIQQFSKCVYVICFHMCLHVVWFHFCYCQSCITTLVCTHTQAQYYKESSLERFFEITVHK